MQRLKLGVFFGNLFFHIYIYIYIYGAGLGAGRDDGFDHVQVGVEHVFLTKVP